MNLFSVADRYCQSLDWKKLSLFKLCCIAFGVMMALFLPEKAKKPALIVSMTLFSVTYIPLMMGFIKAATKEDEEMYV